MRPETADVIEALGRLGFRRREFSARVVRTRAFRSVLGPRVGVSFHDPARVLPHVDEVCGAGFDVHEVLDEQGRVAHVSAVWRGVGRRGTVTVFKTAALVDA